MSKAHFLIRMLRQKIAGKSTISTAASNLNPVWSCGLWLYPRDSLLLEHKKAELLLRSSACQSEF